MSRRWLVALAALGVCALGCGSGISGLDVAGSDAGEDSSSLFDVALGDELPETADDLGEGDLGGELAEDAKEPEDLTDHQGLLDLPLQEAAEETEDGYIPEVFYPDTTNPLCEGNGNGILEYEELPALKAMGAVATFTQNKAGSVVSVPNPGGKYDEECNCLRWDFSAVSEADEKVYDSVLPVESFWFASRYEGAQFVQFFGNDTLGIYSLDESGLYLHGLASVKEDFTSLVYDTPVPMLSLPMQLGDNWKRENVKAEGLFEGEEYPLNTGVTGVVSVDHSFYFAVDKSGRIKTISGEFDVLRVITDVTMNVRNSMAPNPFATVRYKLALYLAECTGLVARVRSQENELKTDFDKATEFRRWGGLQ